MDERKLPDSKDIRPSTDGMFRPATLPVGETDPEPAASTLAPESTELIEAPTSTPLIAAPRRGRAKAVLVSLLVLVLLAGAGAGGWYYWHHRQAARPSHHTTSTTTTDTTSSPEPQTAPLVAFELAPDAVDPVLKEIQAKINSSFSSLGVDKNATDQAKLIRYHYQADSYDIIVTTPDALGIRSRTTEGISSKDAEAMLTATKAIFTSHKYTAVAVPTIVEGNQYMTTGSRLCELSADTISCAAFSDIDQQGTKDRLFYQALQAKKADEGITSLYLNQIVDSLSPGYQLATVGLGQSSGAAAGLFYLKPGGSWVFFTATQSSLPCSKYQEDAEVRVAYKGHSCSDANNKASVVD